MRNLDYGIIGNCSSAALVSKEGSLEWLCLPHFDSASVFAAILDPENGGHFSITSDPECKPQQRYIRNTNILVTSFETASGSFDLIDFMPRYKYDDGGYHCPPDIIRYIKVRSGTPRIRVSYNPQLNYAVSETQIRIIDNQFIKSFSKNDSYESVYLYTDLDFNSILDEESIELTDDCFFILSYNQKLQQLDTDFVDLEYQRTRAYWMSWTARSELSNSAYKEEITRSLLVLKLLSFQPTGALLAAATTSLPESIGTERNWDYRYCWIRDASMTISILAKLGHESVAKRYIQFILNVIPFKDEKIQIMYGIRGEKNLEERTLPHLSGFEGSKPVRVGNAAFTQKQNDIYGVLLDVIHYFLKKFQCDAVTKESLWTVVRSIARTVSRTWVDKDRGIWEYRSSKQHFTFSKLLCWMAMDRASSIADLLKRRSNSNEWKQIRNQIKKDILENGWNDKVQSFTQFYGSEFLDAANLLMEPYGFISADDPKYISTVKVTEERLCHNGLMFRYRNEDDFGTPESSFTLCSFWMISALFKTGQVEKAHEMYEKLLSYSNHLGLFSEDIDFTTGRLLGNFPQAYSHLGLIDTAITLCEAPKQVQKAKTSAVHYDQFSYT
ncbi:MAG: glycoside hydrolase family 15 protein [Chitinispirillaceae bacterium]